MARYRGVVMKDLIEILVLNKINFKTRDDAVEFRNLGIRYIVYKDKITILSVGFKATIDYVEYYTQYDICNNYIQFYLDKTDLDKILYIDLVGDKDGKNR